MFEWGSRPWIAGIWSVVYRMEHLAFFLLEASGRGFKTALGWSVDASESGTSFQQDYSPNSLVKDALEVSLRESRALEVLVSLNFLGTDEGLLIGHGLHALLPQRVEGGGVVAKIELGADENNGDVGSVVVDFGVPLELVSGCIVFLWHELL